jgi:glucosylceramidase
LPADVRETVMRDLFGRGERSRGASTGGVASDSGIALSFMRVPMGASDFSLRHYSYDDVPSGSTDSALRQFSIAPDRAEKLPLIRSALAINPAIRIMASPWSPPGWMKTTNSLIKGTLQPRFYDSFAEYFVKFIRAYEEQGVPIYAISLQNEPNFEPDDYPGMRLDPAARARLIADHIGPRFAGARIRTLIWEWDHNWDLPQQPLDVLADTGARKYIQGVAWHCYGGDVSAQSTVHDRHPDKDAYFSECSGGEWAPKFEDNLLWFVNTLIIGGTRNWARGVLLWNLALDENHGPHLGGCGNCRGVVTIDTTKRTYTRNEEYYALAHASKFLRPGARRIYSDGGDSTLTHVAFLNVGDSSVTLIVLNSASTPRKFVVSVSGAQFTYELPRASVATFVVPREVRDQRPVVRREVPAQRGVVRREDRGQPASIRR